MEDTAVFERNDPTAQSWEDFKEIGRTCVYAFMKGVCSDFFELHYINIDGIGIRGCAAVHIHEKWTHPRRVLHVTSDFIEQSFGEISHSGNNHISVGLSP